MKNTDFFVFLVDIFLMVFTLVAFCFGQYMLSGVVVFLLVVFSLLGFDFSQGGIDTDESC